MILRAHLTIADEKRNVRVLENWTVRGDDDTLVSIVQLLVNQGFSPADGFPVDALVARMEKLFGTELLTIDERADTLMLEDGEIEGIVY